MLKQIFAVFSIVLAVSTPAYAANTPLPVVASFSILGDMIKQIGGDDVAVTTLVGPDGDTHTYTPTPDDAKTIAGAKLVFVNGLGFEGWIDRLVKSAGGTAKIVVASQGVTGHTMTDDGKTVTDPHAWQDLSNGRLYAHNIADALEAAIPADADAIRARAKAYDAQLQQQDAAIRAQIAAIPASQRRIVTSHDAFGYFGRAYGVTFLAPEGVNTEVEPTAADIAKLSRQIRAEGVHTLFFENMANTRLIAQIGRDTGARIGGTLYADALSAPGGAAPTYLQMFTHNMPLLLAAMRETAPAR